jgi:hypothetical protein
MNNFIKLTLLEDNYSRDIWVSPFQIKYIESDESHNQKFIYFSNDEIKVRETVSEILKKFKEKQN